MGRLDQASCANMIVNNGIISTEPLIEEQHMIKKQEYKSIQTKIKLRVLRDKQGGGRRGLEPQDYYESANLRPEQNYGANHHYLRGTRANLT